MPIIFPSGGGGGSGGPQTFVASSPVTLSSADILSLDTVPKTLVAAAGAGTVLIPLGGACRYKATATPYSAAGLSLAIANLANAANFPGTGIVDPFVGFTAPDLVAQTSDTFCANTGAGGFGSGGALTLFNNQALVIQANGPITGGTGTMVVVVYYATLTLT